MVNSVLLNDYARDFESIVPAIEALIFASEEPVSIERLIELFSVGRRFNIKNKAEEEQLKKEVKAKKEIILKAIEFIKKEFNEKGSHGIYLSVNDNGISFKTKPEYFDIISGSLKVRPLKFTGPQLETLSIIAYKQPVTKNEIDAIRGFDSASTIKFLLEKNLVRVAGRKDIIGRPLIYKTTDYFIEVFNLKNLNDLPSVKEMEDVLKKGDLDGYSNAEKSGETGEEGDGSAEAEGSLFE